jgi:oxygen-independent coproporphyrinogen-3 oxidase
MGVQDFDPKVQETVGRIQGEKETADLVEAARANGYHGVNLDLIYGLPYQTTESWEATLRTILAMRPDRMAVFGFAYTPWFKPHQNLLPKEALPSPEARVRQFIQTVEAFTGAGYRLIGLDHFAREGDELARAQAAGTMFRNFQGYTVRPANDTLSFGVSSISDVGGAYGQNPHKLKDWEALVLAGQVPVERGAAMTADDVLRRFVINRVMCQLKLDLGEVEREFGAENRAAIEADLRAGLAELEADGLVAFDGRVLTVKPLGQMLVRNVAMLFDAYLKKGETAKRFSRTV